MTCPGVYPTVLDGRAISSDNNTIEFECLSGHTMSGRKRITCTNGVWQNPPTCRVIRQYSDPDVFPDWWFYALSAILAASVLTCCLCLLCHYCCCKGTTVYPYNGGGNSGWCGNGCGDSCCRCCRKRNTVRDGETVGEYHAIHNVQYNNQNGVFLVPVNPRSQGGFLLLNKRDTKNSSTNTDKGDLSGSKNKPKTTDNRGSNNSGNIYGNGTANESRTLHVGPAWTDNGPQNSKAWKDSSNTEAHSDGDLHDRRKPAKEVKIWMPHTHPIRNINTSTK